MNDYKFIYTMLRPGGSSMDTTEVTRQLGSTNGERMKHSTSTLSFSPNNGHGDRNNLSEVLQVLRRRRTVIMACIAVVTIISAVIIFNITPRYTAESAVLLDTRK